MSAPKPPNLARIVELNRGPFLGTQPTPPELPVPAAGSQLLDVRPVADHLAGHLPGAVGVPVFGTSFSTKAGFVLDADRPVTVLASSAAEAERAIARPALRRVPRHRRVRPRRRRGDDRSGGLRRARRPDRGGRDGDRRPRARRARRGLHPRQPQRPVSPHAHLLPRPPRGPADRHDLQLGPAGRDRRQHPPRRGASTPARSWTEGSTDWLARGATAVTFRRCGN